MTIVAKLKQKWEYAFGYDSIREMQKRAAEAQERADALKADVEALKQMKADLVEIAEKYGVSLRERVK